MNAYTTIHIPEGTEVASITLGENGLNLSFRTKAEPVARSVAPSKIVSPKVAGKRGPKSLPKTTYKPAELHDLILQYVATHGPSEADDIRQHVMQVLGVGPEITNIHAWALVQCQNEGCKHGSYLPKTGPLLKLDDGRYTIRIEFKKHYGG